MKTATYKSVPVIASVIGSKSRKAMYLTHVTSLNGDRLYNDAWITTSWKSNKIFEYRYSNKELGIHNQQIFPGKYYKFHFEEFVLMTADGPVNEHGSPLSVDGLQRIVVSYDKKYIEWEETNPSYVQFPLKKQTAAMDIQQWTGNKSNIKSILVNGKIQRNLELTQRFIIHVPTWLFKANFKQRATLITPEYDDNFSNDDIAESIIEQTAYDSETQAKFDYLDRSDIFQDSRPSASDNERSAIAQWELDNPEYMSTDWS